MMDKRAYIGDTAVDLDSRIFSIGVPYWQLRLNQTTLFSQLTLLQTKIKFAKSVEEVEGYYSQQDMIFAIYKLVEAFGNNEQYLRDSARAVKYYAENGYFSEEFSNMDERNAHLNKTINKMIEDVSTQTVYVETLTPEEISYWEKQIMSKNYYTDPQTGEHLQNVRENTVAIMGDDDFFKDLQSKFHDSANAWVYTMVPESKIEKYKKARIKRAKLNATRNSLMALDVTLDYDTQNALLESGIMENGDFGQNADAFVDYMIVTAQEQQKKSESASIGDFGVSAIVSLVVAILSTVAAIVPAIIVAVQNKRARENNEKYQEALGGINGAQQNIASTGDFFTAVREFFSGTGGLLFWGATALLALYYFS